VDCGEKYRRMPLSGEYRECDGRVNLTVHEGSVTKYVDTATEVAEEFGCHGIRNSAWRFSSGLSSACSRTTTTNNQASLNSCDGKRPSDEVRRFIGRAKRGPALVRFCASGVRPGSKPDAQKVELTRTNRGRIAYFM